MTMFIFRKILTITFSTNKQLIGIPIPINTNYRALRENAVSLRVLLTAKGAIKCLFSVKKKKKKKILTLHSCIQIVG